MKTLDQLNQLAHELGGEQLEVIHLHGGEQVDSFTVGATGYYLDGRLPDEAAVPENGSLFRRWVVGEFLGGNYDEARAELVRLLPLTERPGLRPVVVWRGEGKVEAGYNQVEKGKGK